MSDTVSLVWKVERTSLDVEQRTLLDVFSTKAEADTFATELRTALNTLNERGISVDVETRRVK